ncbi:MAG: flagellin lysine-N-methylase [Myxococcaceae bacterium]|nr:flagellin lysine-N-methylase [Myxococcaceae bacterium]
MSSPERITLRYFTQFKCVGGSCRENCCTGLKVQLSEENHRRLEERSAKLPQLKVLFDEMVKLEPEAERSERRYARIAASGPECPFLDEARLCHIHMHAGEDALADPCSLFPRTIAQVGNRLELSATLACPEAARLCLTSEGAVDSVEWAPGLVAREIVVRSHEVGSADPYVALLDDVRQVCLDVLFLEGLPMVTKLVVLLELAVQVEPFFHRGTTTFSGEALQAAVDGLGGRIEPVQGLVARTPRSSLKAVKALAEMLLARTGACDNVRFNGLVRPMLLKDVAAPKDVVAAYFQGRPEVAKDPEVLRAVAERRSELLVRRFGPRVEQFLQRAAVNSVVKDWYTQQETLASSLRRLIVRLALSRFVLLMDGRFGEETQDAELDELAVEAFQIIAKNVEHVPAFMALCEAYLKEQGLDSVEGAAAMLVV